MLNPGFEDGHYEAFPECWDVDQPVADTVAVVDAETAAEFPIYNETGVGTVEPYDGSWMLRVSSPRLQGENQNPKPDRVSQTFTPASSTLRFAFRLFSWEHRGVDRFAFNLTNESGTTVQGTTLRSGPDPSALTPGLVINVPGPGDMNCAALPCASTIDVGNRQQFLDSGWIVVEIGGIPVDTLPGDGTVTLSYEAGGTDNNAIPTWAYFDGAPSEPIACFDVASTLVAGAGSGATAGGLYEGNAVALVDCSTDPDGDIAAWSWTVTDPDGGVSAATAQSPLFLPLNEGQYSVSLTVTDSRGGTSTVVSGQVVGADTMPYLDVLNALPLVDARARMEVLEGSDVELRGAYVDWGVADTHTAAFSVLGLSTGAPVIDADVASGLARGSVRASASIPIGGPLGYTGTFSVTDNAGGSGSDPISITVVPDEPTSREPNDSLAAVFDPENPSFEAPQFFLDTDGSYLSWLIGEDVVDVSELRWSGQHSPFPEGSEVLVTVEPPTGVDLDVALVAVSEETLALGQLFGGQLFGGQLFGGQLFGGEQYDSQQYSGQLFGGQLFGGQLFGGQLFGGQLFGGQLFGGQLFGGILGPEYDVNGYQVTPLSSTVNLDDTTIGSGDISPLELGLGDLPDGVQILAFGASAGDLIEQLQVALPTPGMRLFAVVLRANDTQSTDPYRIDVRASAPPLALADSAGVTLTELNAQIGGLESLVEACEGSLSLVTMGATSSTTTLYGGSPSPLTIFVTQRERMVAIYGEDAVNTMEMSLFALADHPSIQGRVISVPSTIFDSWDQNPCDVQAANAVTEQIRSILTPHLASGSSVANIVFVGSDNIIPFRRVSDSTVVGNESNYAVASYLDAGSPLFHAFDAGYYLTDDYYLDRVFTPHEGSVLYVPDVASGRLVETPGEIAASADAFIASNGILDVNTAQIAGYDFFSDHANAVAGELASAGVSTQTLINDSWTGDDLRCQWGLSPAMGCPAAPDFSDPSAHYTHWAALSAGGFFTADYTDWVLSSEIVAAGSGGSFAGSIGLTIGCHAGFNAPDEDILSGGLTFDPTLDFPQAMAQVRAVWVASTGYGIGDDEALAYTELLLLDYAQQLLGGGGSAGAALVAAKVEYLGSLATITNYDRKVSNQTVIYGLPQYAVHTPSAAAAARTTSSLRSLAFGILESGPGETVTETIEYTPTLQTVTQATGSYLTWDGDFESIVTRPRVARKVDEIESRPEGVVHGAIAIAGTYTSTPGHDPVVTAPNTEWGVTPEPQVCLGIFWPPPVAVNAIGGDQRLIVHPDAFRCDVSPGDYVTGTSRVSQSMTVRMYRSNSADFIAPTITDVRLVPNGEGSGIAIEIDASDASSGVAEGRVVRYRDGIVSSVSTLAEEPLPNSTTLIVSFDDLQANDEFVVYVVDGAGNVAIDSAKGHFLRFIDVDAGPDQFAAAEQPVTFTGTVVGFGSSGESAGLVNPVTFQWSFGDGTTLSGALNGSNPDLDAFAVDGTGAATFSVTHTYAAGVAGELLASLSVADGGGATGVDTANVYVCGDPRDVVADPSATIDPTKADLIGCGVSVSGDAMTITLYTAGDLEVGGLPAANGISYRLHVGLSTQTSTKLLKYRDGAVTGLKGLDVAIEDNSISFTFSLRELGKKGRDVGATVMFAAETRTGVESTGSAGLVDALPDGGAMIPFPYWP